MEPSSDQQQPQQQPQPVGTTAAAIIQAASAHPLQEEVALSENAAESNDNMEQQPPKTQPRATSKANWVRFDDDVLEISETNTNDMNSKSAVHAAATTLGGLDAVDSSSLSSSSLRSSSAEKLTSPLSAAPAAPKRTAARPPSSSNKQPNTTTTADAMAEQPALSSTTSSSRGGGGSGDGGDGGEGGGGGRGGASQHAQAYAAHANAPDVAPAVLTTESTTVNLNASGKAQQQLQQKGSSAAARQQHSSPPHHNNNGNKPAPVAAAAINSVIAPTTTATSIAMPAAAAASESAAGMRTIELSTGRIREGFANGDVIVTLLPTNTKWPWITPAIFRPELVPEELMAQGLTLTVEDYVNAMETLVNDYRFTVYNVCYKRILICWIFFAFAVLLTMLFSGLQGVALFSLGVAWLFLNAAAIFLCMWVKLRLSRGLEKCLARVNRQLMKHKILLVLDDRGRISCHKVNLCFMYFDAAPCVKFLDEFLEQTEQNGGEAIKAGWEAKLDIDLSDIVIQGNNPVRLSRKQAVAQELFLSYLQRWGKDFLRRRLDWTVQEAGVHEIPRHMQSSLCPCQYEEEVLLNKIKLKQDRRKFCGLTCVGCYL